TRAHRVLLQLLGDTVIDAVGALGREALGDAEDREGGMLEPEPRRRAPEQVPVAGEELPDLTRVALDRVCPLAILAGDAELLEPDALRIEHAEDVVVRLDEQRR